ncbi:MAG: hypothetical protein Q8K45_01890 [Rubrivivax sp.]|nr:hypothetical protein [Rubrivivax sp.]
MTLKIPTLPPDKAQHFFWGAIAGLVGGLAALLLHQPVWAGSLAAAAAAGLWKEWRDRRTGAGTPERLDFVATVAGAVPQAVLSAAAAALASLASSG